MKKIIIYLVALISVITLLKGCGFENNQREATNIADRLRTENKDLNTENRELITENEELKNIIKSLEEKNDKVIELKNKQVKIITQLQEGSQRQKNLIPIYDMNIDSYEKYINYYLKTDESLSLEEGLGIISQQLSEVSFSNLPIEFHGIEVMEGKKIAIVDLREFEENIGIVDFSKTKGVTWRGYYFQGSAGGSQTSLKLLESFLQRDFKGDWIDGVKFLYNGNTQNDYSDHVSRLIGETHYR